MKIMLCVGKQQSNSENATGEILYKINNLKMKVKNQINEKMGEK